MRVFIQWWSESENLRRPLTLQGVRHIEETSLIYGRPTVGDEPRKLIAIRLDANVLSWLRKTAEKKGLPYQSLVNEILAGERRKAS